MGGWQAAAEACSPEHPFPPGNAVHRGSARRPDPGLAAGRSAECGRAGPGLREALNRAPSSSQSLLLRFGERPPASPRGEAPSPALPSPHPPGESPSAHLRLPWRRGGAAADPRSELGPLTERAAERGSSSLASPVPSRALAPPTAPGPRRVGKPGRRQRGVARGTGALPALFS